MRRWAFTTVAVLLWSGAALAQNAVLQGGPMAPGHAPMYIQNGGSQPIIQDSGSAAGGPPGVGLSEELTVTRSPTNTYPSANSGNGPLFTHKCMYDAPITNPTGYHYLCFDPDAQGGALIATGAGGGATPQPLYVNVNGVLTPIGGSSSSIIVGSTTIGSGVNGQLLYDNSGVLGGLSPGTGVATALGYAVNTTGGFVTSANGVFANAPTFTSLTGYCYANGSSPISCATTIPATSITNSIPTANNNTALAGFSSSVPYVLRLGYANPGDAPSVLDALSGTACSFNSGNGDGGYQVKLTGGGCAVGLIQIVDNRIWGAKNDCSTDDTTKDQAVINYALTINASSPPQIVMSGPSLVTGSLYVDRPVSSSVLSDLEFSAGGSGGGFCVNGAVTVFNTTLGSALSQRIAFDDLVFQSSNSSYGAYVYDSDIVRVTLSNTSVFQMGIVNAGSHFIQNLNIIDGLMQGWQGTLISTSGTCYAVNINHVDFEAGPAGFSGDGISCHASDSVNLIGNTFESSGQFYHQAAGDALTVIGNYFENNSAADLSFGASHGVVYSGNSHVTGTSVTTPVILGNTVGIGSGNLVTQGTTCTNPTYTATCPAVTALYDDTGEIAGQWISLGDASTGALNILGAANPMVALPSGYQTTTSTAGYVATAGQDQAHATQLTSNTVRVETCASDGIGGYGGIKLPPSINSTSIIPQPVIVSNRCGQTIRVYGANSDTINGAASGTGVTLTSGSIIGYYNDVYTEWFSH